LKEEGAELVEVLGAELLCPRRFEIVDCFADGVDGGGAAWGEKDALGTLIVGVGLSFEVVEALEFAEQVVEGLFADP
jgi:hypothetical protein